MRLREPVLTQRSFNGKVGGLNHVPYERRDPCRKGHEASAEAVAPVSETTPEAALVPAAKSIRESTKEAADLFTEKIKGALKN